MCLIWCSYLKCSKTSILNSKISRRWYPGPPLKGGAEGETEGGLGDGGCRGVDASDLVWHSGNCVGHINKVNLPVRQVRWLVPRLRNDLYCVERGVKLYSLTRWLVTCGRPILSRYSPRLLSLAIPTCTGHIWGRNSAFCVPLLLAFWLM